MAKLEAEKIGDWLQALRLESGLAQRKIAAAADIAEATLSKIETGKLLPNEEQCTRLAKAFKIDENELQARRMAEEFLRNNDGHPATALAMSIIAERAGEYRGTPVKKKGKA